MTDPSDALICFTALRNAAMGQWATKRLLESDTYSVAARWLYELALLAGGPSYAASWFSGTGDDQAVRVDFWGLLAGGWLVHSSGQTTPSPSSDFADQRMTNLHGVSSWRAHAPHFRYETGDRPGADTRNIWLQLVMDDGEVVDIGKDAHASTEREAFVLAVLAWLARSPH